MARRETEEPGDLAVVAPRERACGGALAAEAGEAMPEAVAEVVAIRQRAPVAAVGVTPTRRA